MDSVDNIVDLTTTEDSQLQSWNKTSGDNKFDLMILSQAGKPIYSFSKREDAVTLMPLCSALIDYARKTQKEMLQSIRTSEDFIINFYSRPPLTIIITHDANSFVDAQVLAEQVEAQIISTLTAKTLKSVFEERPTYDLKRSLYGSEKLIDAIINVSAFRASLRRPWVESYLAFSSSTNVSPKEVSQYQNPSISLPQRPHRVLVPMVVMPPSTRDSLVSIINSAVNPYSKNMVFSLLFRVGLKGNFDDSSLNSDGDVSNDENEESIDGSNIGSLNSEKNFHRLMTVCNHHDRHKLKIADIHLLLALLCGSSAHLISADCLWMPICLPKFNEDAFLHSFISYINDSKHCLVLMSIDRNDFSNCQEARQVIEQKIDGLLQDSNQRSKIYYSLSPLVHPVLLELQDKLTSDSLTDEELSEVQQKAQIYNSKVELYHARQLRFLWYQTKRQVLLWQRSGRYGPTPIIYYMTTKMLQSSLKHLWLKLKDSVYLGWHVPSFQLYAQFDGSITTNEATEVIQRITSWIKKEEDNFSIKDYR